MLTTVISYLFNLVNNPIIQLLLLIQFFFEKEEEHTLKKMKR